MSLPPRGGEKRKHPRTPLVIKVRLTAGDDGRSFEATLTAADVGLGGIFFQSEFALKIGSQLTARFELPESGRVVEATGPVIRVEQYDTRRGIGRSGFALRFEEFEGEGMVALASVFLAPRLREFVDRYLRRAQRTKERPQSERDRLVDALVAWEIDRTLVENDL
jgi:hypothetical protein